MTNNKISIVAVGDICLGESSKSFGIGVKCKINKNNKSWLFENVKKYLIGDIVFGNLECVLSNKGLIKNSYNSEQFRNSSSKVDCLTNAGFNILNVANNHSIQHGLDAFNDMVTTLEGNNIEIVGYKKCSEYYCKPIIKKINNKNIGILGYCFEKDRFNGNNSLDNFKITSIDNIYKDIKKLKSEVDLIILSVHWGLEYMDYPSPMTVRIAREFVDHGANIILGHHSHVAQGTEIYKGCLICYSLGNFVFDMPWCKKSLFSIILRIDVYDKNKIEYEIIPIKIDNDYRPNVEINLGNSNILGNISKKINNSLDFDYEKSNIKYYTEYNYLKLKYTILSNLYLLLTTFTKTPFRLIPAKLKYLAGKIIPLL